MGWLLSASVLSKVALLLVCIAVAYGFGRADGESRDVDEMGFSGVIIGAWTFFIMVCILKALTR